MKKILKLTFALALTTMFCCGCGTLNQKISNDRMTKKNIEFAETMPQWPNYESMYMEVDGITYDTDKFASRVMPVIPVLYWSTMGSFEGNKFFVNRKVMSIVPVFYLVRENVFNKKGERYISDITFNLACVIWVNAVESETEDYWRTGLIWLPGLGPCIGFGSDFFQFAWIPFSDMM
jgi:hypothetical protein